MYRSRVPRRIPILCALLLLFSNAFRGEAVVAGTGSDGSISASTPLPVVSSKVTPRLRVVLNASDQADVLVFVRGRPDLRPARALPTKEAKGAWVFKTLYRFATISQAGLRRFLDVRGVDYQPFWLVNMLRLRADAALVNALAQRSEVTKIDLNVRWRSLPSFEAQAPSPAAPSLSLVGASLLEPTVGPWGVSRIGAPQVWTLGVRGQGIVVAGADTGVQWDHEALRGAYRGWDGTAVDHNYNWHDAWSKSPLQPSDDVGHGTHTIGTAVGAGPQHIGVAPDARWIACRNMRGGFGTPASYVDCFQFFLAPTDLAGRNPRPDLAPHVVNNSWACVPSEGCYPNDPLWQDTIQPAVEALTAAGIAVVASAGNSGAAGCGTVNTPPAIYPSVFTVGATQPDDSVASFSSRGPILVGGRNDPAPDFTAPGVGVLSSIPGNAYASLSGTSMAAPHVAGTIALLWSAAPQLIGRLDVTEQILRATAAPQSDVTCGGDADGQPNNVYGWGVIDAQAAVAALDSLGVITGTVREVGGWPIAGVDVALTSEAWSTQVRLVTDAEGRFDTPLLMGTYRVTVDTERHFAETRAVQVKAGAAVEQAWVLLPCVDWDGDRRSGLFELQRVAADWRNPAFAPSHDINRDGRVDLRDLAVLSAHFNEPCR